MKRKVFGTAVIFMMLVFSMGLTMGCAVDVNEGHGGGGVSVGVGAHAGVDVDVDAGVEVDVDVDRCGVDIIIDVDHHGYCCDTDYDSCCDPCPSGCDEG